jgi:hypothetical protein
MNFRFFDGSGMPLAAMAVADLVSLTGILLLTSSGQTSSDEQKANEEKIDHTLQCKVHIFFIKNNANNLSLLDNVNKYASDAIEENSETVLDYFSE